MIAMNGTAYRMTFQVLVKVVFSKLQLTSVLLFCFMVAMFNAPTHGVTLSLGGRYLIWLFDCVLVTSLWMLQFWLIAWVNVRAGRQIPAPLTVLSAVGVAAAVWMNYLISRELLGGPALSMMSVWLEFLRYQLIALVFEVVTVSFIMPQFEQISFEKWGRSIFGTKPQGEIAEESGDMPEPTQTQHLRVNQTQFPVEGLRYLKSVEHYVEFNYDDETRMERAVLRDLVDQLDGVDGIQPHRSYWVARTEAENLIRKSGKHLLTTVKGEEIPVARNRRIEVENWLNA
ncbi:LytTR family transcriptional regulator [Thalassovita gelatinovora]|nr:LytTR family transcriptional regulator [Thalassovita gelatinovora]